MIKSMYSRVVSQTPATNQFKSASVVDRNHHDNVVDDNAKNVDKGIGIGIVNKLIIFFSMLLIGLIGNLILCYWF